MAACLSLRTHYSVHRWNGSSYDEIFNGLVTDMDATPDEVVFYGENYLNLLQRLSTTTSSPIRTKRSARSSRRSSATLSPETTRNRARLGFMTVGTVDTVAQSTTVISAYTPRLDFLKGLATSSPRIRHPCRLLHLPHKPLHLRVSLTSQHYERGDPPRVRWPRERLPLHPVRAGVRDVRSGIGQKREARPSCTRRRHGLLSLSLAHREGEGLHRRRQPDGSRQNGEEGRAEVRSHGPEGGPRLARDGLAPWDGYDLGDKIASRSLEAASKSISCTPSPASSGSDEQTNGGVVLQRPPADG